MLLGGARMHPWLTKWPQPMACPSVRAAVEVAEPELVRYALAEPNDPMFHMYSGQWHLHQVAAPAAWEITTGHKQASSSGPMPA